MVTRGQFLLIFSNLYQAWCFWSSRNGVLVILEATSVTDHMTNGFKSPKMYFLYDGFENVMNMAHEQNSPLLNFSYSAKFMYCIRRFVVLSVN